MDEDNKQAAEAKEQDPGYVSIILLIYMCLGTINRLF